MEPAPESPLRVRLPGCANCGAQRRVHGQGFFKSTVKYLLLGWAYFAVALLALAATLLLILWFV